MKQRFGGNANSYNKYLDEAIEFCNEVVENGEEIVASAHEDRGDCRIYIKYSMVRNNQLCQSSIFIPVYFMSTLSTVGRNGIYNDLLGIWRSTRVGGMGGNK